MKYSAIVSAIGAIAKMAEVAYELLMHEKEAHDETKKKLTLLESHHKDCDKSGSLIESPSQVLQSQ